MADIFISYARPDRDRIEDLGAALEAEGYSVWWDRQIIGGEDFYEAIERELTAAKVVIVAWSKHSFKSRWVKDEASVAAEAGKIIALNLDGTEPPIGFKQFHAIDAANEPAQIMDDLKKAIALKLEGGMLPASPFPQKPSTRNRANPLTWVLGIAALALITFFAFNQTLTNPIGQDRTSSSAEITAPEKSIAVLPFADMSENGDQEYFSDGVSEEILNALVRVPNLKVAGRTSSFYFKGQNLDIREIADTLDVAHVLEGSVRTHGDKVRITAQLIRAQDGFHMWSQTYDGQFKDIFNLQENISRDIAEELDVILNVDPDSRFAVGLTENKDAYDWYQQGRNLSLSSFKADDLLEARALIERAVKLDPEFAIAWAELVRVNGQIAAFVPTTSQPDLLARVKHAAEQAIRANPDLAMSQLAMQRYYRYSNQLKKATEFALKAVELEPDNAEINGVVGDHYSYLGRTKDAIPYLQRANELDPMRTDPWLFLSVNRHIQSDFEGSDRAAKRAVSLGNFGGYTVMADNAFVQGNPKRSAEIFMELYKAAYNQMPEDLRAPHLWEATARAYYRRSQSDIDGLHGLVRLRLSVADPEINGFLLATMARTGLIPELFDYWGNAGGSNSLIGTILWSDLEWAKAIRQHPSFSDFAKKFGYLDEWKAYGWPDKCRPIEGTDSEFECD